MSTSDIKDLFASLGSKSSLSRWGDKMQTLTALSKKKKSAAYLFEFHVFLSTACDVLELFPGAGWCFDGFQPGKKSPLKPVLLWPLAPGAPENFSCISGVLGKRVMKIRPGVDAKVPRHATTISPDVSLREIDDKKKKEIIVRMWDAKYRAHATHGISRSEAYSFALAAEKLGATNPSDWWASRCRKLVPPPTLSKESVRLLLRSGLATNAQYSTEPESLLKSSKITETRRFGFADREIRGAGC